MQKAYLFIATILLSQSVNATHDQHIVPAPVFTAITSTPVQYEAQVATDSVDASTLKVISDLSLKMKKDREQRLSNEVKTIK